MSLEIIVFFKTRPFGKYMYNLPSLEIKDKNQVSGTGPLDLLLIPWPVNQVKKFA